MAARPPSQSHGSNAASKRKRSVSPASSSSSSSPASEEFNGFPVSNSSQTLGGNSTDMSTGRLHSHSGPPPPSTALAPIPQPSTSLPPISLPVGRSKWLKYEVDEAIDGVDEDGAAEMGEQEMEDVGASGDEEMQEASGEQQEEQHGPGEEVSDRDSNVTLPEVRDDDATLPESRDEYATLPEYRDDEDPGRDYAGSAIYINHELPGQASAVLDDVYTMTHYWTRLPDTFLRRAIHPRSRNDLTGPLAFEDWPRALKSQLARLARHVGTEEATGYIEEAYEEREMEEDRGNSWLIAGDVEDAVVKAANDNHVLQPAPRRPDGW